MLVLISTGDEPLDLSDKYYLAMDWRTNERLPVHCLVQNKEVGFSVFTLTLLITLIVINITCNFFSQMPC